MSDLSLVPLPYALPEALVLVDPHEYCAAIDAAFCRAMQLDREQLLNAPLTRWVEQRVFAQYVQPALQRCYAGEVVTHQLELAHPELGTRQFSVTYHPCPLGESGVHCAMILRDVTSENLANDGYLLYSQWRDALNAIDRAGLNEQSLQSVTLKALERLHSLIPYRQVAVAVIEELAEAAGAVPAQRAGAGLCFLAVYPGSATGVDGLPARLPLMMQGELAGEVIIWPAGDGPLDEGQLELFGELVHRLERALRDLQQRALLSRYTVDLEHTIVERTLEIERREERERLASELHDAVTQSIYSLTLFAEAGRRLASVGQLDRVQEYLTLLGDTAQQAMKQMRLMLYELRPAVLGQVGLVQALRQRLDAVERRAGIDARLEIGEPLLLSPTVEENLYRICQEALNNALKHAAARSVVVRLRREGAVVLLEVSDDGIGFAPPQPEGGAGLGLNHIRERAAQINAGLQIETALDQGTTVRVSLLERGLESAGLGAAGDGSARLDWTVQRAPEEGDH